MVLPALARSKTKWSSILQKQLEITIFSSRSGSATLLPA